MKAGTILSLEQATALPYATLRFVQMGWRVIRIEAAGTGSHVGDPNRYVGHEVAGPDRHAVFIGPNVGKEAIALNLKSAEGQQVLKTLLTRLSVDVFCCNVLPKGYGALGIDYETLAQAKPDLIWASISALGPDYPDMAGYDPVIQAMSGVMDINGDAVGSPTLVGLPLTDLKAGDEVYAGILLALLERATSGKGKRIDVSMLQAAASWLMAVMPLVDLGAPAASLTRAGNAHRQFVPTNVYPARDGHIYLAVGNNSQWNKLVTLTGFGALACADFASLDHRSKNRAALYAAIGAITRTHGIAELQALFSGAGLPHSTINTVAQAMQHPALATKLTRTDIDGRAIRLPPPAVDQPQQMRSFTLSPHYGEHTDAVLMEAGFAVADIAELRQSGAIA
jgi:crotonobetainyl-CoA:carnitine CoA-transferase CaiB-like acyl-CoA transferase